MLHRTHLEISTSGRGFVDVTRDLQDAVRESGVASGLCHLFLHHTSASLILCENADPTVRRDLEAWFAKAVPDGDPLFEHTAEGPDDMPAHVRTVLTQNALSLPVEDGTCDLGTWQGVYVWEHRRDAHRRRLTVTIAG